MKGQLSAEMLILLAVVLAIVALVAYQLVGTAEKAQQSVNTQSEELLEDVDSFSKGDAGDFCTSDEDCKSGNCNLEEKVCE
ncbi:class III signal peptide-containing protein [Candidatus Micrarchaeota archaeon]|nr:class III signal peptide-containing protein [Candidatus Micrarchaeota archaeon]